MKNQSNMIKRIAVVFSVFLFSSVFLVSVSLADTLVVPGGGSFYTWTNAVLTSTPNTGAPFWNHSSWDGTNCNVGFWMAGLQSGCSAVKSGSGISPTGNPAFLAASGSSGNTDVSAFYFTPGPGDTTQFQVEVTAYDSSDVFGWYEIGGTNDGLLHPLFSGTVSTQTSVVFTPSGNFGYYLIPNETGAPFKTGVEGSQFVMFSYDPASPTIGSTFNTYWIGAEDLAGALGPDSDYDYNDMVVKVTAIQDGGGSTTPVPEPASLLLLGTGLAALGLAAFRRRK